MKETAEAGIKLRTSRGLKLLRRDDDHVYMFPGAWRLWKIEPRFLIKILIWTPDLLSDHIWCARDYSLVNAASGLQLVDEQ